MNRRFFRHILSGLLLIVSSSATLHTMGASVTDDNAPNVHLVATLNNGPAMRPVKWSVYRLDNNHQETLVQSFERHSASIPLKPGRYRAQATFNNVSRTRIFDVSSNSSSKVVVAMD